MSTPLGQGKAVIAADVVAKYVQVSLTAISIRQSNNSEIVQRHSRSNVSYKEASSMIIIVAPPTLSCQDP